MRKKPAQKSCSDLLSTKSKKWIKAKKTKVS